MTYFIFTIKPFSWFPNSSEVRSSLILDKVRVIWKIAFDREKRRLSKQRVYFRRFIRKENNYLMR